MRGHRKTKDQLIDELAQMRQRIAELERVEAERKRAEEALDVSHRFLEIAYRHMEMTPLLKEYVVEVGNLTGCAAVGVRMLDKEGNIPYQAYEGFSHRFYELESPLSIKSDQCMCINVVKGVADPELPFYTEGGSFYINGTSRFLATVSEEEKGQTRNVCNEFGYESVALVPIRVGKRILGLIHVADLQENMVPLQLVKVLEEVAMQLGLAIQRVWVEEQLAQAVAEWQGTFEAIEDLVIIIDKDFRVVRSNQAMHKAFAGAKVLGAHCYKLLHGTEAPIPNCPAYQTFSSGEAVHAELQEQHLGGRWFDVYAYPIKDKDGTVQQVAHHVRDITERKWAEEVLRQRTYDLGERVKELNCLYGISNLVEKEGFSLEELLRGIVGLIPTSWQYPEVTCARLVLEGHEFRTENFRESIWKQTCDIIVHGDRMGTLEVCYLEERPESDEGPFLKEERNLINDIAERLERITERKRAEEATELAYAQLSRIFDTASDGMWVIDKDFNVLRISETLSTLSGIGKNEAVGKKCHILFPGSLCHTPSCPLTRILGGEERVECDVEKERNDGIRIPCIVTAVPFRGSGGELIGIVENFKDITERKRAEEELRESARRIRELSITDELTGLCNRRHFYEVLETEMYRVQRYGHSLSVVMLDLDGFKEYNDTFGHTSGDAVLKALGQTLKSESRRTDTAFRYGGDEFTIILPLTGAERARKIADRIRSKWLQAPKAEKLVLETPLGLSAGVAEYPENAETADGLAFLADTALYRSKREGGNKSTLVSDLGALTPDVVDRATLDQVYALSATVEAKDPYTYGHSQRVGAISEIMGKAIGLSRKELADLNAAGLLHDIGKVGVTDSILIKPDKPTKDEWKLIRKHSAEGAKIVRYVRELTALVPMIRHHHEWYDGTGYPDGLKGEDIPLGARILAIADAYDTMTTARTYRDVVSQGEALEELRRCSPTQFDPELVEAFSRAMDEAARQD